MFVNFRLLPILLIKMFRVLIFLTGLNDTWRNSLMDLGFIEKYLCPCFFQVKKE